MNKHPDAQWFPDAGLGLFIHWGIGTVGDNGDISWGMLANKPWTDITVKPSIYFSRAKDWKPDRMDYDTMLGQAKAAGFTYAVMVTKHHDGYALWSSKAGDFGTRQFLDGHDFVKEYVAACRKHGLKVGLYYSPPDWWFDRQYKSFSMGGKVLDMNHQPVTLPEKPTDHDAKRRAYVAAQVTELLTQYGKIDLLWFDGGRGEISNTEVRRLQPGIVINSRNGGRNGTDDNRGDYGDSEGKPPTKRVNGWFETCETCWPSKKWSYTEVGGWDTAPEVIAELVGLRAWGGNLLANVGPKADGSVPEQAAAAWREMAEWMKHSRESVTGAGPGPFPELVNAPVTTGKGVAYVHFLPGFKQTVVWKDAPEPKKATLLRTGAAIPFKTQDGSLHIDLPADLRTTNVDVVKLEF